VAPPLTGSEVRCVLSKLTYLTLCRSIALLARGDAAKDREILVLRHHLMVLRRQIPRLGLDPADRRCWPRSAGFSPVARQGTRTSFPRTWPDWLMR
jgi:putative transposase